MSLLRRVGCLSAGLAALGLSVWAFAAEAKKKTYRDDYVAGVISKLEEGYQYKDPDTGKVMLEGTLLEVKIAKAKNGKLGSPKFVMDRNIQVSFETPDKKLAVGQYAKVWFDNGDKDPAKQGLVTKVVVAENPDKKKKKKTN
jgi:hypothetical protein